MSDEASHPWRPRRVCILGVGLLGGSVGLAVRRRWPDATIVGVARRPETRAAALRTGAVTEGAASVAQGVCDADLVVIGAPVGAIVGLLRQAVDACDAAGVVITDVGSTKANICAAADREERLAQCFVGSHPLAGSEKTGPEHARSDLFDGRTTIITPTASSDPACVLRVERFWQALGSQTVRMSPEEHDTAVAAVSHVPHVAAAALAASLAPELRSLVSTGWLDTTRIAAGDPEMWRQILEANAPQVLGELERFAAKLGEFRDALAAEDFARIEGLLESGQQARRAL